MKILHFILGKANKNRANGVNQVIAGLAKYSSQLGALVKIIGKAESVSYEGEIIPREGFVVEAYSHLGTKLRTALENGIVWSDIVHLHGVYSPLNLIVARMCNIYNRPYIVTLHDGLSPERSKMHGYFKKKLYHTIFQRKHLEQASGIHTLTDEETTDLLSMAHSKNIFCIPNGIDLDDYPSLKKPTPESSSEIKIGYLGRLSSEKNLEALCEAFSSINSSDNMRLMLAGPSSPYGEQLLKRFASKGVVAVGAKFGADKSKFIHSLDLFVHPSLCDVFSITAMEVLALSTPLLITRTSKTSYFFDRNAFFMCEPTSFGLKKGLCVALNHRSTWSTKTANGRMLIENKLNWRIAAKDMLEAYTHVLVNHK